jgi:hypothetical protein
VFSVLYVSGEEFSNHFFKPVIDVLAKQFWYAVIRADDGSRLRYVFVYFIDTVDLRGASLGEVFWRHCAFEIGFFSLCG